MFTRRLVLLVALTMLAGAVLPASSMTIAAPVPPLAACITGAFSTEEDFMAREKIPFDGNPYVSDGDMLSFDGQVCMRNAHLLAAWFAAAPGPDLGLDALDILNIGDVAQPTIAFSTELDDPAARFTAGDLLFTPGYAIPNIALLHPFGINYDIGLDGVQFIGSQDKILTFVAALANTPRSEFLKNPGLLQQLLRRYGVDIWFTVEGTARIVGAIQILDGDLLSAANGVIVAAQSALLPASVPAGLPTRGVDFGLDAVATSRNAEAALASLNFSTEILYDGTELSFTDGDVLRMGNGVVIKHWELIKLFYPAADFLGLDALAVGETLPPMCENQITDLGGLQVDVADINAAGRGEIGYPTDHPFGASIPFWGTICNDVNRFRVVFRKHADGPGAGTGIPVLLAEGWKVKTRNLITGACTDSAFWFSDANGWYNGPTYRSLLFCNPNLILTNWKSASAPDPNALYRVWLEFDRGAGVETEPAPHLARLDNTQPKINNLGIPGGACTTFSSSDMPIMVQGDVSDDHFWYYRLSIGGDLYAEHYYNVVRYYDAVPGAAHLNAAGTTPLATLVDLHTVTVFDLAANPVRCAYGVRLWAADRTIEGYFNPPFNLVGGYFRTPTSQAIYFDYAP
ncbi:MAG: hypothetical protein FJ011_17275 [Chloroflexi bacterium]|nr:hypothetical protein [Chloroflexota bacterium]